MSSSTDKTNESISDNDQSKITFKKKSTKNRFIESSDDETMNSPKMSSTDKTNESMSENDQSLITPNKNTTKNYVPESSDDEMMKSPKMPSTGKVNESMSENDQSKITFKKKFTKNRFIESSDDETMNSPKMSSTGKINESMSENDQSLITPNKNTTKNYAPESSDDEMMNSASNSTMDKTHKSMSENDQSTNTPKKNSSETYVPESSDDETMKSPNMSTMDKTNESMSENDQSKNTPNKNSSETYVPESSDDEMMKSPKMSSTNKINESMSENDQSIITFKKKSTKNYVIESSDDENVEPTGKVDFKSDNLGSSFFERRSPHPESDVSDNDTEDEDVFIKSTFSPQTRRSINPFVHVQSSSESDSDNDSSDVRSDEVKSEVIVPDSDADESVILENNNESCVIIADSDDECAVQSSSRNSISNTIKKIEIKYVTQEYYDEQCKKLNDLECDLQKSTRLAENMKTKLPDGGNRLSGRIDKLSDDIRAQISYIGSLEVMAATSKRSSSSMKTKPLVQQNAQPELKPNIISWEDLDAGVAAVQPKYTGKIGLQNFNQQKIMTMERLKDIHGSLETCPTENDLADDPAGLKISLMVHQRHALKWMEWRENQRPRGGILADDMGLGKTLTCIAHILAAQSRKENQNKDYENDDDDDGSSDDENGYTKKGRRDFFNGGTLVICPASLIGQWQTEIQTRCRRDLLSVEVHHGASREKRPRQLSKFDIVVTTYQIVARESEANGAIFGVKWNRVIIDEGHVIRNHQTKVSEAVCSIRGHYKWILTGTPIQNKQLDVFALLKFLKCQPFDELPHFKKWIDNKSAGGQQRLTALMRSLLLRRTKDHLIKTGSINDLPAKDVQLVEIKLDKSEMNVYQKILMISKHLFAEYLSQRADRTASNFMMGGVQNRAHTQKAFQNAHQRLNKMHGGEVKSHQILTLILRLRQICNHPGLIHSMLEENANESFDGSFTNKSHDEIDLLDQINRMNIEESTEALDVDSLSSDLSRASSKILHKQNPVFDYERPSTKIQAILNLLNGILQKNDKCVVVSQWSGYLDVIGNHMRRSRYNFVKLTGEVQVKDRGEIVNRFNSNDGAKIMLLSLTAGGVGLNLVGANHLILVDPHWNPQLESQAQDRVYRVGQKKSVYIYKLICNDTIEQTIQKIQERKLEIAKGILDGVKSVSSSKLTIDDMKMLFDM